MTSVNQRELPAPALVAAWCRLWLGGAGPTDVLFHQGHLCHVMGLRLANGVTVVLKLRPPRARLAACVLVQRLVWAAGFPCPEPLAGPAPLGTLSATAEELMAGGSQLPMTEDSPRLFAEELASPGSCCAAASSNTSQPPSSSQPRRERTRGDGAWWCKGRRTDRVPPSSSSANAHSPITS
jgi:hypothetical protein